MKHKSAPLLCLNTVYTLVILSLSGMVDGCVSPKKIVYFQSNTLEDTVDTIRHSYTPTIQKNDMLSIVVGSLNAEANEIFNLASYRTAPTTSNGIVGSANQSSGYPVFGDGTVEMPLLGKVKLEGLDTQLAADTIRGRLYKYLKAPSVNVQIVNFKISVLGEVNRPAVYSISDGKITLPEAISMAGDLTIYGRRSNIMIVREENGQRAYAHLDLTSRTIFDSPYYYLHKNDLIYVEPAKARMASAERSTQVLPVTLSVVTVLSVVLFKFL